MAFFLPLFSALFGLVIINILVLVKARTAQTGWIGSLPVEVRYLVVLSGVLLIGLNANQWMAGDTLFPVLLGAAIFLIYRSLQNLTHQDRKAVIHDGVSLLTVQVMVLTFVVIAFQTQQFFLLELHNHDSLYYYEGSYWARESRLFVANEAVHAEWGAGEYYIGYDIPLYRGGTYTLAAWVQFFSPQISGSGLYYILAYAGTMAWFAVRVLKKSMTGFWTIMFTTILALTVSLSTGTIGSLANSNLATVMGGASLMLVFAIALRSDLNFTVRYGLMAAWCAIGGHFYGESVFYAGLLSFLVFLFDLPKLIKSFGLFLTTKLSVLLISFVIVVGNIPVIQAFSSLLLFSEIAKGGNWFSWYLHHSIFTWFGSFVAGILMGDDIEIGSVIAAGLITIFAAAYLLFLRPSRTGILALICTSILAITYIEMSSYQYGEHKILHLLGPSWALAVVAAILYLVSGAQIKNPARVLLYGRNILSMGLFVSFLGIITQFLGTAVTALNQMRGFHALDFGLNTLSSHVRPSDSVLLDDTEWIGVEKFFKSHYLAFELQHQKVQVLMPSINSDTLRGGYQRSAMNDTFGSANSIEWLVKSKSFATTDDKFIAPKTGPIWENNDFRLYRIDDEPLIVAGNGWYDCEQTFCWTMAPFEMESHTSVLGTYELVIDFTSFSGPSDGMIAIKSADGDVLANVKNDSHQIRIELPAGWSRLVFEPDWQVVSPKELDMSEDTRKLFLAVQRVEIRTVDTKGSHE
jgi:hypothetical protein